MPLSPGTRLGAYEILGSIGAGGMGEVFRARDTRLGRDVALKVLSASLSNDPRALARFQREAVSIAKLSHPNILAVYEFGQHDGTAFVVTELVDGETLRAKLSNGPLAPRRAIAYAAQIARGVAAAHGRGIVHRDLKPENVMIGRDDQVKILDFGLARTIASSATDETRTGGTDAGVVLGTFGYMAPEQVRGIPADYRADIFAFGAVLYEMLSGQRAFKGETAADTMTAILTKDPPELDLARLAIPPSLDRILRRCLEKAPELRFQSATDLAFAIEALSASAMSPRDAAGVVESRLRRSGTWLPWAMAGLAAAAAIALWVTRPSATAAPWQRFTAITEAAGEETSPAISPDGTTVLYGMRVDGRWGIYAQRAAGRKATPIVNDPQRDVGGVAFSPDGSQIAFHEADLDGGIFIAGATGETERRLTDFGFDPTWSPDGRQIAFATESVSEPSFRLSVSSLYVVDVAGGTPRKIFDGDAVQPAWSPSGRTIAFWSNVGGQRDIATIPAAGGPRTAVTDDAAMDWCPAWLPDGRYLYFASDRGGAMNIWRIAIDENAGRPRGVPEPVTNGVQASAALPKLSKDGRRLVFRSRVGSVNPVAIPFDPVALRAGQPRVLDGSNNIRVPSDVSPDGKLIAYYALGERQEDLFLSGPADTRIRRLTDDPPRDRGPMFTRDGRDLVFYSNRDGQWQIWTVRPDGSGMRKISTQPRGGIYAVPSPVDDRIVFAGLSALDGVFEMSWSGDRPAVQLPGTTGAAGFFFPTTWSPDGTRIAGYASGDSGRPAGIVVYDVRSHASTRVSPDVTLGVRWLPDNRRLIYFVQPSSELVVLDTVTHERTVVPVALPGPVNPDVIALSPDATTIYYGAIHAESDIWVAER